VKGVVAPERLGFDDATTHCCGLSSPKVRKTRLPLHPWVASVSDPSHTGGAFGRLPAESGPLVCVKRRDESEQPHLAVKRRPSMRPTGVNHPLTRCARTSVFLGRRPLVNTLNRAPHRPPILPTGVNHSLMRCGSRVVGQGDALLAVVQLAD